MRRFARRSKNDAARTDDHDALNSLLGKSAPTTGTVPDAPLTPVTQPEKPAIVEESVAPGWHQEPTDPELIRYWDGAGWTGLVTPRPLPLSALGDAATTAETLNHGEPPPPVPMPVGDGAGDESSCWRSDPFGRHEGRYFDRGQPTNRVRDGSLFLYDDLSEGGPIPKEVGAADSELPPPPPPTGAPQIAPIARTTPTAHEAYEGHNWTEETKMAVARAETVDTPESWREAAQAVAVLSEMARVMLVAAEAKLKAKHTADAARAAADAAADAKQTAEQTTQAANEAARVARAATDAAADAKQRAERSAQALPKTAQAAWVAAEAAAAAAHQVQELDKTVAKAKAADTPEGWSEALRLAKDDVDGGDQRDRDTNV
jgi:chemotaxis protein histidine kinase CheA